uniref:E3 UFM1-protein ligase 1 homolog n=1 Tax=Glossina brevipalpis TaxID=37001 RepID=A0A1A9W1K1_9MUSC
MSNDWDEVKRLAADFQKAQLTSTLQKLSERNCVEIVTLLLEKQLLEVIFTNDGKEYITPDHLEREIQDELYLNGGRTNLVEVSKTLNVDLSRIEKVAEKIAKENVNIHFILGQLIDEDYITYIAQEIQEKLQQKGEITVNDLTEQLDLPSDFLQHDVIEKHLGKIIKGRQDPTNSRNFFTQAYIQRSKAKIRGALSALTRPTNVSAILQQINVQHRIFHTLLDELAPTGQVTSKVANSQYVPHIYARMQTDWVNSFYRQNGFLEYETITKLGVGNAKQFINKHLAEESLIFLKRWAINEKLLDLTIMPALMATKQFLDLSSILPSNMSATDKEELFEIIVSKKLNSTSNHYILLGSEKGLSTVFTAQYLEELIEPCREMAKSKAKKSVESGNYQQYLANKLVSKKSLAEAEDDTMKLDKKDERRKKASSGKAGGGSQGRETKTKSTKKHARGVAGKRGNIDSEEEDNNMEAISKARKQLELVTIADVTEVIDKETLKLDIEELNEDIAALYHEQLNQLALNTAQEVYEATLQKSAAGGGRQSHASVQEKINTLLIDLRLYEKGLKLFPANVQTELVKYLLKSMGNDICNELLVYVANEFQIELKNSNLNVDQRNKLAQECGNYKLPLLDLNKALTKTVDDFVVATEVLLKSCSMIIKKVDKKKDRQLIIQHREKLLEQLKQQTEPAVILHLTALILFTTITGCILHASGKFVAQILTFIKTALNDEQNRLLNNYQDLVINVLRLPKESEECQKVLEELQEMESQIKLLVLSFEKPGFTKAD